VTVSVTACDRNESQVNPKIAAELTEKEIVRRLEAAGRTALSMPKERLGPTKSVTMNIDVVHEVIDAYGWNVIQMRVRPSATEISEMEEAFGWLNLIERKVLRQIVALRAMVHPITDRHLYSWRRLSVIIGADYKSIQLWHRNAVKIIFLGMDKLLKKQ
jgi:hypothetical protein